ncbi:hypothetical protein F5H01DRAFT_339861 [Linnemannia elongata]|nr:hypothetical protein F5H01DRAFT_339861 [Linnemannia elongata]
MTPPSSTVTTATTTFAGRSTPSATSISSPTSTPRPTMEFGFSSIATVSPLSRTWGPVPVPASSSAIICVSLSWSLVAVIVVAASRRSEGFRWPTFGVFVLVLVGLEGVGGLGSLDCTFLRLFVVRMILGGRSRSYTRLLGIFLVLRASLSRLILVLARRGLRSSLDLINANKWSRCLSLSRSMDRFLD